MIANSSAPAVLAGLGITQAPYWLFAADISAGTVRRILRDREPARIPIRTVRPASRRQPSKVAVFVDFLAELLVDEEASSIPNRDRYYSNSNG
jgi:DNA-binding transcriptional LysR family regulator